MKGYITFMVAIPVSVFSLIFLFFWFVIGTGDTSKWEVVHRAMYVVFSLFVSLVSLIGPGVYYESFIKFFDRQEGR